MAPENLQCIENLVNLSSLLRVESKIDFCEYLSVCEEASYSRSCYQEHCNKCHIYKNFRSEIWE